MRIALLAVLICAGCATAGEVLDLLAPVTPEDVCKSKPTCQWIVDRTYDTATGVLLTETSTCRCAR